MKTKPGRGQAVVDQKTCVACGCCMNACPLSAVTIYRGMYAQVDAERCVGCGKCAAACPASVIEIEVRE